MKEIIKAENFIVNEVEGSDIEKWIKEEFQESHPMDLLKATFPDKIMEIISSDHHKSRDYGFIICYDHQTKMWHMRHDGYIREVEASGKSYLGAAQDYLRKIRRENEKVLYHAIENQANEHLPSELSVEIGDNCISIFEYKDGHDAPRAILSIKHDGSLNDIMKRINEYLNEEA